VTSGFQLLSFSLIKLVTLTKYVRGPPQLDFLTETKRGFLRENDLFLLPATDKGYTPTDVYFP